MQLVIDHLWQSTLFVLAAALLTLGLRANAARGQSRDQSR